MTSILFPWQQLYTDVLLSCDGAFYPTHRLVVASSSRFIAKALQVLASSQHPVILLHGISNHTLQVLITFMYDGKVGVRWQVPSNIVCVVLCLN